MFQEFRVSIDNNILKINMTYLGNSFMYSDYGSFGKPIKKFIISKEKFSNDVVNYIKELIIKNNKFKFIKLKEIPLKKYIKELLEKKCKKIDNIKFED